MSTKNSLKHSTIRKRSQCLNSSVVTESANEINRLYGSISKMIERKNSSLTGINEALKNYINLMGSHSASEYYWQPIKLIESLNSINADTVADKLCSEYTSRILPYVEDLDSVVESVNRSSLTDTQKDLIVESAREYNSADRIIKNHNLLSKRFNINESVNKYRVSGLQYFVEYCANMVSTYSIADYQKMNITLEEATYVLDSHGVDYSKPELVKYVVEYYLTQKPIVTDDALKKYQRAIDECYMLEESDKSDITHIFSEKSAERVSINNSINQFLTESNKTPEKIENLVTDTISQTTVEDITHNIDALITTVWNCSKNKIFESDETLYKAVNYVADYIYESATEDTLFVKEDVTAVIDKIEDVKNIITLSGNANADISKSATEFIDKAITPALNKLLELNSMLYKSSNLNAIKLVNESDMVTVVLSEFKLFKFHNLVRAAFNLDKFLKVKEKRLYEKGKSKIKKFLNSAKNVLFGESVTEVELKENIFSYIGEDCKAEFCIRQYPYNESELTELTDYLESVCAEYNDVLLSQGETSRVYYIINPGLAEVRLKEATVIDLTEDELAKVNESIDNSIDLYLDNIAECEYAVTETLKNVGIQSVEEDIAALNDIEDFDMNRFKLALEAMSIIGVSKETVTRFADKFNNYCFNKMILNGTVNESYISLSSQERSANALVESYVTLEGVDWNDKVEAYSYLQALFEYKYPESADDDDEDDEDDEEEEETSKKSSKKPSEVIPKEDQNYHPEANPPKNGYKGSFNINSIALALKGLATKFKDMDSKQKEASRNLDSAVRAFTNGVKRMFVNDNREAIIKGSVIPSFSRCIKAGIVLTGLGIVAGPPVAVIAGIGGLALSKKVNKRERMLLLDEIETELEVVEKELAIADSNNNMQKYRTLLQYKKELQRQYQRIKYNIKVGSTKLSSGDAITRSKDY